MTPMPTFAAEKMATWTGGHWVGTPVSPLSGFTADTRTLVAGQGFVALKTAQRDGHDFLEAAAARGAVAALVSQAVSGSRLAQLVVADPLRALQRIAREHRREFNGTVIGVTGRGGYGRYGGFGWGGYGWGFGLGGLGLGFGLGYGLWGWGGGYPWGYGYSMWNSPDIYNTYYTTYQNVDSNEAVSALLDIGAPSDEDMSSGEEDSDNEISLSDY